MPAKIQSPKYKQNVNRKQTAGRNANRKQTAVNNVSRKQTARRLYGVLTRIIIIRKPQRGGHDFN